MIVQMIYYAPRRKSMICYAPLIQPKLVVMMTSQLECSRKLLWTLPQQWLNFIRLGEVPNEWKIACISPTPNQITAQILQITVQYLYFLYWANFLKNISGTSQLVTLKNTIPYLHSNGGFSSGRSTTGALLAATDQWHKLLDSGLDICTVFFDYSKAFDTVPHRLLLQKEGRDSLLCLCYLLW